MPVTTLTGPPRRFASGDTVIFTTAWTTFSPASWNLDYVLARNGNAIATTRATASGSAFLVTLTGEATTAMTPGQTDFFFLLTEMTSGERQAINRGLVFIAPNPVGTLAPSVAQQQLTAAQAAMQRLISGGEYAMVNFSQQEFTMANMKGLQDLIDRLQAKVDAELYALGVSTRGGARVIRMGFR